MTSRRWQQAYDLFNEALRLAPADWQALLETRCALDPELRALVERLLASDERAEQEAFLVPPVETDHEGETLAEPRRLRICCPHCNNPIELVEPIPADRVQCPSCLSTFQI